MESSGSWGGREWFSIERKYLYCVNLVCVNYRAISIAGRQADGLLRVWSDLIVARTGVVASLGLCIGLLIYWLTDGLVE